MITCPNKSLKAWKDLVASVGEGDATLLWHKYEGFVPEEFYNLKKEEQETPLIKGGVEELFNSNPELANAVYSKILTNSGLSSENLLSLLLKDNLIEKQCP